MHSLVVTHNYCAVDLFSPPVCCGHRECKLAVEGEYCLHLSLLIPIPPVDVLMHKTLLTSEAAVRGSGKENKPLVISSCYFAKAVFSAVSSSTPSSTEGNEGVLGRPSAREKSLIIQTNVFMRVLRIGGPEPRRPLC